MKIQRIITALIIAGALSVMLNSCNDGDDDDNKNTGVTITLQQPSAITETGFTANWSITGGSVKSVLVQVAGDKEFKDMIKEVVADPGSSSQAVDGLHGASEYCHRIRVTLEGGTTKDSDYTQFWTGYQSEPADVTTSDGLHIKGDLYYLSSNPAKSPAIILMGHLSISNMWKGEELFLDLLARGYICYIFSYRGHPGSDPWDIEPPPGVDFMAWADEFIELYVSQDLQACYDHLKGHPLVDTTRIGLMGGSLGANMSMFGNNWPGVKVSVGLTTSRLGLDDAGILHNVLFVVSELDGNSYGNYIDESWYLYNMAAEPREIIIIPGDFHGIDMLVEPSLKGEILEWINARMGI